MARVAQVNDILKILKNKKMVLDELGIDASHAHLSMPMDSKGLRIHVAVKPEYMFGPSGLIHFIELNIDGEKVRVALEITSRYH